MPRPRASLNPKLPGAAPNDQDTLHLNAYVAYVVGSLNEAEAFLDKIIRNSPDESAYHFDLGLVKWNAGETGAAASAFLRAASLNTSFADAFYNAAIAEARAGDRTAAAQHFRRAWQSDLFLLLRFCGDRLRHLTGHSPAPLERYGWRIPTRDFPVVLDSIGQGLMENGNFVAAAVHVRRALALEPTAERHRTLGTALEGMNKFRAARHQFEIASRLGPGTA